jgi:hypothetical protein
MGNEAFVFKKPDGSGAHRGVGDFYDSFKSELVRALTSGQDFDTGWYGVKHEIESGRIWRSGNSFGAEVSVSDDFDCGGTGLVEIPVPADLATNIEGAVDAIVEALDSARDLAEESQLDNNTVGMYCVAKDGGWQSGKDGGWQFTYLVDLGGDGSGSPPGDAYHRWGWQEVDTEDDQDQSAIPEGVPADIAKAIVDTISRGDADEGTVTLQDGWTVRSAHRTRAVEAAAPGAR